MLITACLGITWFVWRLLLKYKLSLRWSIKEIWFLFFFLRWNPADMLLQNHQWLRFSRSLNVLAIVMTKCHYSAPKHFPELLINTYNFLLKVHPQHQKAWQSSQKTGRRSSSTPVPTGGRPSSPTPEREASGMCYMYYHSNATQPGMCHQTLCCA